MKKKIILSFLLLFLLLLAGILATLQFVEKTTDNLTALLLLHKVEAIRQDLVINVQTVQANLYTTGTAFGKELDIIVDNVLTLGDRAEACMGCHHEGAVEKEIIHLLALVNQYKEALSYFITSTADQERVRRLQVFAADIGDRIIEKSQWMTTTANNTLHLKTSEAMAKVASTKKVLTATLAFAFGVIVLISIYFIRSITEPVAQLLRATRKIKEGELHYRIEQDLKDEFGELAGSFNDMSNTLGEKELHIQENLRLLKELHKVALPLHAAHELPAIVRDLGSWLATLVEAEGRGFLLPAKGGSGFRLQFYTPAGAMTGETEISGEVIADRFRETGGKPLMTMAGGQPPWPFGGAEPPPDHGLAVWLVADRQLEGALVATKRGTEGFREEEVKAMELLANNLVVAMVNIRLYQDLEARMEELQKTQQQLVQAEKLTAVGTLAGGIAHDFNNILCGMLGHVALLKLTAGRTNRQVREGLEVIEQAGFRAASLIKQLMTFSRQKLWEKKLVSLNEKISSVINLFEKTVSKLIVIKLSLAEELPAISGDPGQIEQVIMNLCVNARDAMPAGGTITISTSRYQPGGEDQGLAAGDYVLLRVADTGIGMDAATVSRIFEPFFTTKEMGKGTGLGLAIVHGIVERHGGSCRVMSTPGQGTTFAVYLPVGGSVVEEVAPAARPASAAGTHGLLVVDDEAAITTMIESYLGGSKWTVFTAAHGQEAVKKLLAHQEEIDLVVLDLNMPVMGGEETFQRLKAIKPELKFLIFSGYSDGDNARQLLEAGADDFIHKPFRLEELIARINGLFEGTGGAAVN